MDVLKKHVRKGQNRISKAISPTAQADLYVPGNTARSRGTSSSSAVTFHPSGNPPKQPKTSSSQGPTSQIVAELDPFGDGHQVTRRIVPATIPEAEYHDLHGLYELPGSGRTAPLPSQSNPGADLELSRVEQRIRKAINARQLNFDAVREKGVDVALEYLLADYQPALAAAHALDLIEQQIRAATRGILREKDVNNMIRNHGAEAALEVLIQRYEPALNAERTLDQAKEKIVQAVHSVSRKELDSVFSKEGILGTLRILIEEYHEKASSEQKLDRVEEQIRGSKHRIPRKDLDTAFKVGGVEGALNLLLKSYQSSYDAEQELLGVEQELSRASRGILSASDLNVAMQRTGVQGALKLLVKGQNGLIDDLRKKITTKDSQHSSLERDNKRLNSENYEFRQKQSYHQININKLKEKQEQEVESLESKWKTDLNIQREEATKQTRALEQRHKEELGRRDANHRSEVKQWEQVLISAKEKHNEEAEKLQRTIDGQESEYNAKIDKIRDEFAAREEESRRREISRMEQYRLENEALKGELVARKHFKGLSDPEICSKFKKLAGEVDSFSRLQWEKRKESHWPLSESALKRSENPRKLKQHIVQSSIWAILNDMIFRSPFQIFGEEGQRMHRDWTENFGEDRRSDFPHWPEATEESEKWRYELVKECLDALKKPSNDSDTKRKWKRAHDESLGTIADDIYKAVEAISAVTTRDLQTVQGFVKLAATFWLEIASLRCRILLVFPPLATNVLGGPKTIMLTGIELVVQPEVRRRGNAQGQRLDTELVVKGCEGEHTKFQPR